MNLFGRLHNTDPCFQDEVLAISEKVVLRVEDLITWITLDAEWTWGRIANYEAEVKEIKEEEIASSSLTFKEDPLDFADVEKERKPLGNKRLIFISSAKIPTRAYKNT